VPEPSLLDVLPARLDNHDVYAQCTGGRSNSQMKGKKPKKKGGEADEKSLCTALGDGVCGRERGVSDYGCGEYHVSV